MLYNKKTWKSPSKMNTFYRHCVQKQCRARHLMSCEVKACNWRRRLVAPLFGSNSGGKYLGEVAKLSVKLCFHRDLRAKGRGSGVLKIWEGRIEGKSRSQVCSRWQGAIMENRTKPKDTGLWMFFSKKLQNNKNTNIEITVSSRKSLKMLSDINKYLSCSKMSR